MKKLLITLAFTVFLVTSNSAAPSSKAVEIQDAFSNVADKAFPAVVVINTTKKVGHNMPQLPPGFEFFFGPRYRWPNQVPQKEIHSRGSGFIINEHGYIVTNHHVVGDTDRVTVQFKDKREFDAKLIGTDKKSDLAVIKIDAGEDLPYLEFGNSDKVRVGHWAIAVGAPFNMDYSMTVGVVSQKARSVGLNVYENYIQTDASINPGNSGGPLLNIKGEVIGVNDFIISPNGGQGGNIGLGFAIPSNMAKNIIEQLMSRGKVDRPWIGIGLQDLDDEMRKHLGVSSGVLVREVFKGNPAEKYGVEPGDIITHVGEKKVNNSHDLQFAILNYKPDDMIPLSIIRDGDEIKVKVKAERQQNEEVAGVSSRDLNKENNTLLASFGLELAEDNGAIYVSKVLDNSSAALSGIRRGMQVKAVNRKKVKKMKDVKEALKRESRSVLLYVSNGRTNYFVVLSK